MILLFHLPLDLPLSSIPGARVVLALELERPRTRR
jgi:hypothetical protein